MKCLNGREADERNSAATVGHGVGGIEGAEGGEAFGVQELALETRNCAMAARVVAASVESRLGLAGKGVREASFQERSGVDGENREDEVGGWLHGCVGG